MKKHIVSTTLILIGLTLALYPKTMELYEAHQQQALINEWQQDLAVIDSGTENSDDANKQPETETVQSEQLPSEPKSEAAKPKRSKPSVKSKIEGMLVIDKIKLKLPILKGATRENLNISVASLKNTGKAGAAGNYALAAHRSRKYGKNFNRLDELEAGDRIDVNVGDKTYSYTVTEKLYVKPDETWVLSSKKKTREITLITCHPMINPTERLIVKGEMNETADGK